MNDELWVLQSKDKVEDYWLQVTAEVPFSEVQKHVDTMLSGYRSVGRQHYYRAYCVTNEELENKHWQALVDFPDFDHWDDYGKVAVMKDGSRWQLI